LKRLTGIVQTAIINTSQQGADMKELQAYIDRKNRWNAIFKGEQFEIQTAQGRQRVADALDADLSPENLTCDGELPRAEVNAVTRCCQRLQKNCRSWIPASRSTNSTQVSDMKEINS